MKVHILALFLTLGLLSATCNNNNNNTPSGGNPIKWEKLLGNSQCAQTKPLQELALTQEAFDQQWNKIFADLDLVPDKPQVDFSKKAVLFICLGETNKGGHQIVVDNIEENGNVYKVSLTHKTPGPNCMSTMSIEFPFIIVAFDKGKAQKADFAMTQKVEDCK